MSSYLLKSRLVGCSLLLAISIFSSCKDERGVAGANEKLPPNVVFIAIDDLNDWVGCLGGHPQVRTPNIDKLAAMGTLFTNAHAQSPICNPSRTSILTGFRPSTTGVYGLSPWIRSVEGFEEVVTLPQHFSSNGYTTYSGGKIYHGDYGRHKGDREFDSLGPPAGVRKRPKEKLVGKTPGGNNPLVDWGSFQLKEEETADWEVARWAVDIIDSNPATPFFLSVGFFLPHVPLYAPDDYFDMYPPATIKMPPFLENDREDTPRFSWYNHWDVPEPRWKWMQEKQQDTAFVRAYLASISFVDKQVGRVLGALEASENMGNTIVVLWSDHGFHLGEKEISGKNTLWERSTHVPLIFAGPGIGQQVRCSETVELLDIYPTLNKLCRLPDIPQLEGHDLGPQLRDHKANRIWPAITTNNYENHSVRTKRWRYIRYADGSEELYDLRKDVNEWYNLLPDQAYDSIVGTLAAWIPKENKLPEIGNGARILQYENDRAIWQGNEIRSSDPIPGLE